MAKKTILKPTLREKKRYIAFEVVSKNRLQAKDVAESVWQSCLGYLGEKGCAAAGIHFMNEQWNMEKQKGLIRVENTHVNDLKTALALIKKIGNEEIVIRSLGTSGIIKKAEEKYLAR